MRKAKLFFVTALLTLSMGMTTFAGTWQAQEDGQWKYQNDDGGFATGWIEDDGKSYYLDDNGIMLTSTTTPDGYTVGADGVQDGQPQNDGSLFSQSGRGDQVISDITVSAPSFIHITNDGDRNFIVWSHHGTGDYDKDLLVNRIGDYEGDVYLQPGTHTLEIKSSGDWSVKVYPLGTSTTDSFSGNSDYVTPYFIPSTGIYAINYEGDGNFIIWGYYGTGKYDKDLLVNEIGNYSGSVLFKRNNYSYFVIKSKGNWSISPK